LDWIASPAAPFRKDIFYAVITRPQGRGDPAAMAAEVLDCFVGCAVSSIAFARSNATWRSSNIMVARSKK